MLFVGNAFVREPFLTGASSHTKEAQLQKGSRTFNMSKSYDGSLLDHLAEYMITSPVLHHSGLALIQATTMNFT